MEGVARAALAVVLGKLLSGGGSAVAAVLTSVTGAAAAAVLHRDNNTLFHTVWKIWVFSLSVPTCQQSLSPLQLSVPVLQWASATETEHSNRTAAAKARRRAEGSTRSTEKEGIIRIAVHNFLASD